MTVDREQARKNVSQRIFTWKSQAESRNLNSYMANYADTIDYYQKSGASIGYVRNDKQRAFTLFDSINISIDNMHVSVDDSGESATAAFDKAWVFEGAKHNSGKVRSQLKLRKINGEWLITGERDLKVYYVNR